MSADAGPAKTLGEAGQGVLGITAIAALVAGFTRGWGALPWTWLLGGLALGLVLLGTADVLVAREASRRIKAADRFLGLEEE